MSRVELKSVSKQWATANAVDNVSFSVEDGKFLVLLGPSGCGKSTTLRLIAGLEQVSGGTIMIGEQDVTHLPSPQRKLSMVFQSYALFPHLTVEENILFGLKIRKVPAKERILRLGATSELLGLSPLLKRKPSQLSGGQQQRVALARALVAEPTLCLMDEPLSNLDAKLRHEMRQEIRSLQKRLGITMIYVTHDQTEAMSMADNIILMNNGKIEQCATPDELYKKPRTTFAASFIGTPPMNLVRTACNNKICCIAGTEEPVIGTHNADCVLGVRPENLRLVSSGTRELDDWAMLTPTRPLPATIVAIDYFGADSIVDCKIGREILKVREEGHYTAHVGDAVHVLMAPPEHLHSFDINTLQRISV